jgi:hypothetical protein
MMRGPPSYPYYDEQESWPRTQVIFPNDSGTIDYMDEISAIDRWLCEQAGNAFQSRWSTKGAIYWIKCPQIAVGMKLRFGGPDVLFVELVD